jgi:hypothetical protein
MENTQTILGLDRIEMLTEPAPQTNLAPAMANPGFAVLLRKWVGYALLLRAEPKTASTTANDEVEDDWEKWVHGCGRAVR